MTTLDPTIFSHQSTLLSSYSYLTLFIMWPSASMVSQLFHSLLLLPARRQQTNFTWSHKRIFRFFIRNLKKSSVHPKQNWDLLIPAQSQDLFSHLFPSDGMFIDDGSFLSKSTNVVTLIRESFNDWFPRSNNMVTLIIICRLNYSLFLYPWYVSLHS